MSHGSQETSKLKANVEDQLNRLMTQLQDLEDMKGDLDAAEYESTKRDTVEQLAEFEASLKKMMAGNMTLVSELGVYQLAMQAAVRGAFKSPEVVKLFAKRQPGQLRQRLADLERDSKMGRLPSGQYESLASELLTALKKLGDTLTAQEQQFLNDNSSQSLKDFQKAETNLGQDAQAKVLNVAGAQVKQAAKK